MNPGHFYLGCFIFGVLFSSVSFVMGYGHALHLHLPFGHGGHGLHAAHGMHAAGQALHAGHSLHGGHGAAPGHQASLKGLKAVARESGITPFNSLTATAFITFFGAAGTLIHAYTGLPPIPTDILAVAFGFAGGGTVFYGMSRFVAVADNPMNPALYDLMGTVARVSAAIPAEGTGEVFFTKEGSNFTKAAKSAQGIELSKGTEVVITRFEKGTVWVEAYDGYVFGEEKKGG